LGLISNSSPHLLFKKDNTKKAELKVGAEVGFSFKFGAESTSMSETLKISFVYYPDPSFKDRAEILE